jgi:biotin carboxylase
MQPGLVLYLGTVRRGECESLLARGVSCGVLEDTKSPLRLADTSRFALVDSFDFSRPRGELVQRVREIRDRYGLSCLVNMVEHYVTHTADVAEALGVPGLSRATARLCVDKKAMRQRFLERIGPRATARFQAVASEAELLGFADVVGYPVFLQPDNLFSSLWSTCNNTAEELVTSYRAMREGVPRYYEAIGQRDKRLTALAAEYLEGRNRSIDCLIDADGNVSTTPVVDVMTGRDIGIDDFHHFARVTPSELGIDGQEELKGLAVAGVKALGMAACDAHVEFIGNRLGEIGARPGGNRPRILEMAYGIDAILAYCQVLSGGKPDLRRTHERSAAIVTPFPQQRGTLRAIRHLEDLARLPAYHDHEVRIQLSKEVGLARDGFGSPLYIELTSADATAVRRSVNQIASWTDLFEVE